MADFAKQSCDDPLGSERARDVLEHLRTLGRTAHNIRLQHAEIMIPIVSVLIMGRAREPGMGNKVPYNSLLDSFQDYYKIWSDTLGPSMDPITLYFFDSHRNGSARVDAHDDLLRAILKIGESAGLRFEEGYCWVEAP